jgi:hypothetical protein
MRRIVAIAATAFAVAAAAQWNVHVPIEMVGTSDADRQVIGVAHPLRPDAAVSLDAGRTSAVSFTPVQGTSVLTGTLAPAPSSYATGMIVTVVPQAANAAAATLALNGLGALPILKGDGIPLEAGDLPIGVPARLLFDGTAFRVLSSVPLPCANGYHVGGREFCVEDSARAYASFYEANTVCRNEGARLCSFGEWVHACRKTPTFISTVTDYEWVDSAANHANTAKMVGNGSNGDGGPIFIGCLQGALTDPASNIARFRCCKNR